uniref:Glycosyltransferase family 2 protein n=1 Tax=candidate division WOR-3 bacterium TaxID=2052148 RepID=A0A7C2K3M5_UNCW3
MKYSAVIPTYKRGNELKRCVVNLINQTLKPSEIVISGVEGDIETYEAFENIKKMYPDANIRLVLTRIRGISAGRNNGLLNATNDLILMIDDDVELPADFAEKGLKKLLHYDALILTGIDRDLKEPPKIQNFFRKLFFFDYYDENRQIVLPSGAKVIAYRPTSDLRPEYLGSHVWIMKRELINYLRFDETMITYSHREDQDFSYSVYKKFGPRLVLSPDLKFKHLHSPSGRLSQGVMSHIVIYNLMLNFRKHFFNKEGAKAIFMWSLVGLVIRSLHQSIKMRNITIFVENFKAVVSVINNWNLIKHLKFFRLYEKLNR